MAAQLTVEIARLNKELNDSAHELPAYELRQRTQQVTQLEQKLSDLQEAPKKFSFRRSVKQAAQPQVPVASVSIVSSSAPASRANEMITKLPSESLTNLSNCIVSISSPISALHASFLTRCVLILPAVSGSLILHDLHDCILLVDCHQFRIHTSKQVDVYISCPSPPIIESCSSMRFTSHTAELSSPFKAAQDFSHVRDDTPSPNWTVLPDSEHLTADDWDLLCANRPIGSPIQEVVSRFIK